MNPWLMRILSLAGGSVVALFCFLVFFLLAGPENRRAPAWEGAAIGLVAAPLEEKTAGATRAQEAAPAQMPPALPPSVAPGLPVLPQAPPVMTFATSQTEMTLEADLAGAPEIAMPSAQKGLAKSVFGLGEVDVAPSPVHKVMPVFPYGARRRGIRSGALVLRLEVGVDGRVRSVRVLSAVPAGVFEESALKAVRKWRFSPGRVQDRDVVTRFDLPIRFGEAS